MERNIYKGWLLLFFMKKKVRKHNFTIEDDVWEEFKIYCIKKKTTATDIISNYIKKLLKKKWKADMIKEINWMT